MKPVATGFPDDDLPDFKKLGDLTGADMSEDSQRFLTPDAASELQQLLQHIGQQGNVLGCAIIGHDGLLIVHTLPPSLNPKLIGQLALGIYMISSTAVAKLGHEHIHQIVGKTSLGYIVIADFGGGLLVTITDENSTDALIPFMRSITQLVAQ